jgi:hypothetical protein
MVFFKVRSFMSYYMSVSAINSELSSYLYHFTMRLTTHQLAQFVPFVEIRISWHTKCNLK